ncbi:ABC-type uncharacterized transport system ATPase subunit [Planomicrobium stackebrandtii]|uniref:ABC-type uncharacterized transport system ATPase subunit n=1 Tax=Planomicrobium stackebrandtii TaxID=253160 RepID=A0ABU0GT89_9BACL|nr:hypothetical protein [Planomicrobium stackebrandtii]MDQ0428567.1 ABC-type uncharacterized transport system ATPase subunit [Planomicrobium stackebrandtii]
MSKLLDVRAAANEEKRDMVKRGTPYRRSTAVYASHFLNDLVSSNHPVPLSRAELVNMVQVKYNVDNDRAQDVAKNVHVQVARVRDRERLAKFYKEADKRLKSKERNKS